MDIELLRTFLAVIQTKHFGRAATQLFITPAAVSARIRQLEQTLGVKLLHRTRGNIQMTTDGERLLPHAKKLIATWLEVQADLGLTRLSAPLLKFGALPGLWALLFSSIKALTDTQAIKLSLHSGGATDLHQLLSQQRLDLALLLEGFDHPDITSVPLAKSIVLGLFTAKNRELNARFSAGTYIHVDWGSGIGSQKLVSGVNIAKVVYCNDLALIRQWLGHDNAYVHLPLPLADADDLIRVADEPVLEVPLHIAYRTDIVRHRPVGDFLEEIIRDKCK